MCPQTGANPGADCLAY